MKRRLYLIAGFVSVALGVIGAFVPLMPTVAFLILAAFCFARSSPELETRLLNHPRYGAQLTAWREKGVVGRKAKWSATAAFAVSIAIGFLTLVMPWPLVPVGVSLLIGGWLWTRPEA